MTTGMSASFFYKMTVMTKQHCTIFL